MLRLKSRLDRLEKAWAPSQGPQEIMRWVFAPVCGSTNLANSTCKRMLCSNGTLMEMISLDGDRQGISDEQIDRFVASFPIETVRQGGAR